MEKLPHENKTNPFSIAMANYVKQKEGEEEKPGEEISQKHPLKLSFDQKIVLRRAALALLPGIKDPEWNGKMVLSSLKSSKLYTISDNGRTATLEGGYRICRASRGFKLCGRYYWEFYFRQKMNENSHVRFGISTIKAKMEYPLGYDDRGYSIRDQGGAFYNHSRFAETCSFDEGDTIGFGFDISETCGKLHFWKNREYQGLLCDNIDISKRWYPAFSIYNQSVIQARFSKPFKFYPDSTWIPASEMEDEPEKGKYSTTELISFMNSSNIEDLSLEILKAIDVALTPYHQMPC